MARSALDALGTLDFLGADSFLYLNDGDRDHAAEGGSGLDRVAGIADGRAPDLSREAAEDRSQQGDTPGTANGLPGDDGSRPEHGLAIGRLDADHANGKAGGPGWLRDMLAGDSAGPEAAGPGVLTEYVSGSWDGEAGYDIRINFRGADWTAELQQAVIRAADYVTGGTADTHADNPGVVTGDIGRGFLSRFVDDLVVNASLTPIDGQGGVLAQAEPLRTWRHEDLTSIGMMELDASDADLMLFRGLWDDAITHEMMHVLGFGTLWEAGRDLVDGSQYTGEAALAAYRDFLGDQSVGFIPVETDGGPGTAGGHWDEAALGNELMTGFVNDDGDPASDDDNFLSEFSVMALADLGYQVAYHDYPYDGVATA